MYDKFVNFVIFNSKLSELSKITSSFNVYLIIFIIFIFGAALYKNYIITKLDYNDLTLVNEEFDHYTYRKGKYNINDF